MHAITAKNNKNTRGHGFIDRSIIALFALAMAFSPIHSIAQVDDQPERAGVIVFVSGEVVARDSAGSDRQLRRRSAVNVGDTLFTAPGASTQIRMVDAALISLKESTQFQIVAYEYNENPVTDESSIELIEGGFRTITGAIGEQNRENYEASISNFATIGIRGTDYEVVITPRGEVITGVYDGGTTVANGQGAIDLGFGADFDFAIVPNPESPPQGLLTQPGGLGDLDISLTADEDDGSDPDEENEDGSGGPAAGGDATDDSDDASDTEPASDGTDGPDDASADGAAAGGADQIDNDSNAQLAQSPADPQNENDGASITINTEQNTAGSASSVSVAPPSNEMIASAPAADTASLAVTTAQQESTVAQVEVNTNLTGDGAIDCASDSGCVEIQDGQAVVAGGNGNSGNNSNAGGNSNNTGSDDNSSSGNGNSSNAGGSGNGNNAGSDDAGTSGGGTTDGTNDGPSSGNGNSGNNSNAGGSGNGNNAGSDDASTTDGGTTGGTNDGVSSGNGNSNSGNNNNADGSGNGNSGNGNSGNSSNTVLLDASNVDFGSLSANQRIQLASVGLTSTSPRVEVNISELPNSIVNLLANLGISTVSTLTTADYHAPVETTQEYGISWGKWDAPLDDNWVVVQQIEGELVRLNTSNYFADVTPTPIANMKGAYDYRTGIASEFIGQSNVGDINSLFASMSVDFDTGVISDGNLTLLSGNNAWSVDFEGLVNQGLVELDASNGMLVNQFDIISNNIEADLGGVFTGNNADAFVGGFELLDANNPANFVEGIYTIER